MLRRITSIVLTMVMAGTYSGAFLPGADSGAGSHDKKTEPGDDIAVVSAEDPWYEVDGLILFGEQDMSSYDKVNFAPAGKVTDGYAFTVSGRRTPDADTDRYSGDFVYSDYLFSEIFTYSTNGDIVSISDAGSAADWEQITGEDVSDSELYFSLSDGSFTYHIGVEVNEDRTADIVLYSIGVPVEADEQTDDESENEESMIRVVLGHVDSVVRTVNGLCSDGKVPVTAAYLYNGDIYVESVAGKMVYDTETGEIKRIECDGNVTAINGTGIYAVTEDGIFKYDIRNGRMTSEVDWNDCDICINDAARLYVVDVTSDGIILAGTDKGAELTLFTLTLSDSNPNEGKTVLTLASADGTSDAVMNEAIYQFNSSDNGAYVRLVRSGDETVDLMTETYGNDEVLSGEEFTDVRGLCDEDAVRDIMISFNDEIYSLPIAISVEGIFAAGIDQGIASETLRTGFTYEEYDEAVSDSFGGIDPLGIGIRTAYFPEGVILCRDLMTDEEGLFDADSDALKALIDFCNTESAGTSTGNQSGSSSPLDDFEGPVVAVGRLRSADMLIDEFGSAASDVRIYGTPSFDGRGPALIVEHSISVSSTADTDAATAFIDFLISEDIQDMYSAASVLPVSRAALENEVSSASETYNSMIDRYLAFISSEDTDAASVMVDPESVVVAIGTMIDSCGTMISSSSAIDSLATGSSAFPSLRVLNDPSAILTPEEFELWLELSGGTGDAAREDDADLTDEDITSETAASGDAPAT